VFRSSEITLHFTYATLCTDNVYEVNNTVCHLLFVAVSTKVLLAYKDRRRINVYFK